MTLRTIRTVATLLVVGGMGCGGSDGPQKSRVTGAVTFQGTPLDKGEIRVLPENGSGTVGAGPIADGEFDLMAEAGSKRIEIRALKPADPKRTEAFKGPGGMTMPALMVERLPKRYNQESTLTARVDPDG
jgi:hypothetical protein